MSLTIMKKIKKAMDHLSTMTRRVKSRIHKKELLSRKPKSLKCLRLRKTLDILTSLLFIRKEVSLRPRRVLITRRIRNKRRRKTKISKLLLI
jgi:hypothetical protein